MSGKKIPSWIPPLSYGICAINSLLLLLMAVEYLFCQVDIFVILWLSSILLFVTVPTGVVCFTYSLFHLRQRAGRRIAIWSAAMVLFVIVVFYLLPPGSSHVPAKMEEHYVDNEAVMLPLANRLYDLMPDSTRLVVTSSDEITLSRIDSANNWLGHPYFIEDSTLCAAAVHMFEVCHESGGVCLKDSVADILKQLHCNKLTIYKPTKLALFDYLTKGFATYWFEVSLRHYTPEEVQQQLESHNTVPFSPHVCFRFYGGTTDADAPFPYKKRYVESLRQRGLLSEALEIDSIVL